MKKLVPEKVINLFAEVGEITVFSGRFFRESIKQPIELREILRQAYELGFRSFLLVGITGFILGLVLTLQLWPTMVEFGAQSWMPAMVGISVIREIGPLITALICAGRVGSSIGAELGSMKVTEQIDAMEVSGTNPFKYLVFTRVLAITLMLPVLVVFADVISLYGCYLAVNTKEILSSQLFISKVFDALSYADIIPALIKSVFFGFAIGIVGSYKGYYSNKGTEGVGRAANSSVVLASLLVFIIDLVVVQVTDLLELL